MVFGWAWAVGAPIIADTVKPAPATAKSAVMVRGLVARIARLFLLVEGRQSSSETCVLTGGKQ
jgi:hypothetical protein